MKAKAAVLRAFDQPLEMTEFEVCPLAEGEVLVKIAAAGVCGSDVHMWHGKTPAPVEDGLTATQIIEAIERSIEEGRTVEVDEV